MKLPYTAFGRTADIELVTYTDCIRDDPPRTDFTETVWMEREEDWYGLHHYKGKTIRIVTGDEWRRNAPPWIPPPICDVCQTHHEGSGIEECQKTYNRYRKIMLTRLRTWRRRISAVRLAEPRNP